MKEKGKIMKKREVKSVNVWMTDAELKKVDRLAKKMHMDRSKYLRYAGTLKCDSDLVNELIKKVEEYKSYLSTARKAVYLVEKLVKVVNFQLKTGLEKEEIENIQKRMKEIEEGKKVLK